MPGGYLYIWDSTNSVWVKLAGTAEGAMSIHAIVDALNDITDVSVAAPTTLHILYWNGTNSKWEARAFSAWGTTAHKTSHQNAGTDEISVAALSGLLADDQHVLDAEVLAVAAAVAHKATHENTGADEISVAALSGLLADDQHVLDAEVLAVAAAVAHESTHVSGGSDDIDSPLAIAAMPANVPIASISFIIDGGGSAITTGEKGHLEIPFACTINQVTMLADQSGSIVVDIWKDSYANFPPTDADSITAAAPPTISAAQKSQDGTLTDWTTAITAGDILAFNVDSIATCTRVTISLKVTKT